MQFYKQSKISLLYLSGEVKGVETSAVNGDFLAADALSRLLQGTGLTFEFANEH